MTSIHSRLRNVLSKAQWRALNDIVLTSGGHGYGEYAYLSRSTAMALIRRGLVRHTYRWSAGRDKTIGWLIPTLLGVWMLALNKAYSEENELFTSALESLLQWQSDEQISIFKLERPFLLSPIRELTRLESGNWWTPPSIE